MKRVLPLLIGSSILASGCAELNSLHRESVISPNGKARVVIVDAKQRNTYLNPEFELLQTAKTQTGWRICAEAAPDVFSAFANSTGGDFGFGVGNQAKLSISSAETAATIERTQTINLLRESFYRTCERYMSGGFDKAQFIVQAARDQRSMVAVLAIEQLTRAARPPSTIISGPATTSSIKDGEAAAKLVEEFRASAATATSEHTAADAAFKKLSCPDPLVAPTEDEQAKKDAYAACVAAKAQVALKEAARKAANDRLDKALAVAADLTKAISAGTQTGQSNSGQGGGNLDSASIAVVADAITKIALAPGVEEPLMYCIAYLTATEPANLVKEIRDKCLAIIEEHAKRGDAIKTQLFKTTFFQPSPPGDILFQYAFGPTEPAERKERMKKIQKAAKKIGITQDPITIRIIIESGNSDLAARLLEATKGFEPDQSLFGA